jgi:hypothetical protein
MRRRNGGIIGVANNPTSTVASGVWSLREQFKAEKAGDWPNPAVFIDVNFLVIAGGGSGGRTTQNCAGGGGAGGYRCSVSGESSGGGASAESPVSITVATNYTVTVGAGGTARSTQIRGDNGFASVFATIESTGGGGGAAQGVNGAGLDGGSGGGASFGVSTALHNGGLGTANQGFRGGNKSAVNFAQGCGGGGAGAPGVDSTASASNDPTAGGDGVSSLITGSSVPRGGGGGGVDTSGGGSGGSGGGGAGAAVSSATNGDPNTGGGGGGNCNADPAALSGQGGSGIVILKYPDTVTISNPGGGLTISAEASSGGFKVVEITVGTGNVSWS